MNAPETQLFRRYPSPAWLAEPAHPGNPTPEELTKYMAYFRHQLSRGVHGMTNRNRFISIQAPSPVMGESSLEILRLIQQRGPIGVKELTQLLPLSSKTISTRLRGFTKRNYTENISEDPQRGLYRIAERGIRKIGGSDG